MKRYRATQAKSGYWHIEESTVFGWRRIDVVLGEQAAQAEIVLRSGGRGVLG